MSNGFHIEYLPARDKTPRPERHGANTIDDKKQAVGSSATIPGFNLLNRNRNVSDLLADIPKPPAWHEQGLCREVDCELFFPAHYGPVQTAPAKQVCAACDVQAACLQWALDNNDPHGVLGGTTPRERKAMLKSQGAA